MPRPGGAPAPAAAPLSPSSLEAFSAAELALSGAGALLLLCGAVFVAGVASASRAAPVLAPFTALWAPRLGLHAAAALALGAMLLRLPGWWSAGPASWAGAGAGAAMLSPYPSTGSMSVVQMGPLPMLSGPVLNMTDVGSTPTWAALFTQLPWTGAPATIQQVRWSRCAFVALQR